MENLPQECDCLQASEALFDALPLSLADGIGLTCCCSSSIIIS
jgi:hypothetical protein